MPPPAHDLSLRLTDPPGPRWLDLWTVWRNYLLNNMRSGGHAEALPSIKMPDGRWAIWHDPAYIALLPPRPTGPPTQTLFIRTSDGTWAEAGFLTPDAGVRLWAFAPFLWYAQPLQFLDIGGTPPGAPNWVIPERVPDPFGYEISWTMIGGSQRSSMMAGHQEYVPTGGALRNYYNRRDFLTLDVDFFRGHVPPHARTVTFTWSFIGTTDHVNSTFHLRRVYGVVPSVNLGVTTDRNTESAGFTGNSWANNFGIIARPMRRLSAVDCAAFLNEGITEHSAAITFLRDARYTGPGNTGLPSATTYVTTMSVAALLAEDYLTYRLDVVPENNQFSDDPEDWTVTVPSVCAVRAALNVTFDT